VFGAAGNGEPMHGRSCPAWTARTILWRVRPVPTRSAKRGSTTAPIRSEEKRGGKVVGVAIVKRSADGKGMTITDEGTDRKGERFSQVLVFEREW